MIFIILIICFYLYFIYIYKNHFIYKSVNTKKDKDLEIFNNFFSKEYCYDISNKLLSHPLLSRNILSDQFKNTYGLVIKFKDNDKSFNTLKKRNLDYIFDILKKIKDPECNAFIFNILIINPKKKINITGHYDNTINIKVGLLQKSILPKFVSVIYAQLPNNFSGGKLLLNKFIHNNLKKPKYTVMPQVGKYVKFRGDMYHGIEPIKTDEDSLRISLVLEQYKINKDIDFPLLINGGLVG